MIDHGRHILADFFGVNKATLKDEKLIEEILVNAAKIANAKILNIYTHKFGGEGGVTSLVALSESHISIHTWPETQLATVDVYMCGSVEPELAINFIKEKLVPNNSKIDTFIRGIC